MELPSPRFIGADGHRSILLKWGLYSEWLGGGWVGVFLRLLIFRSCYEF